MQRIYVRVVGVVQGVWFRKSTQQQALRLGLTGWVRNCSDGSVQLEAQGDENALNALCAWCRRGPPAARVDELSRESIEALPGERHFDVRY